LEGEQLRFPPSNVHPSGSLPPLLGLRPATKGAYPLGTPNSVSPNAVVLRGNLTQSDGDVVSSTTKIFTKAKPFLNAYMKPFDITEIRMLTNPDYKVY
jgi:hypothetical protein